MADLARYIHIWQEVHYDFYRAIARAGLATTTFDVKREPAGFIATHLGLGGICKKVADMVKDASIGGGIRPWRTPNWRLIDVNNLISLINAVDATMTAWNMAGIIKLIGQHFVKDLIDQRGLSGPRNPGYCGENTQRKLCVDVL